MVGAKDSPITSLKDIFQALRCLLVFICHAPRHIESIELEVESCLFAKMLHPYKLLQKKTFKFPWLSQTTPAFPFRWKLIALRGLINEQKSQLEGRALRFEQVL